MRGFLGKRNDEEVTEFVTSFGRFLELQNDHTKEVTRTIISDDEDSLLVVHKTKNEEAGIHGNIALAAMTTAYARIALYKVHFVTLLLISRVTLRLSDSILKRWCTLILTVPSSFYHQEWSLHVPLQFLEASRMRSWRSMGQMPPSSAFIPSAQSPTHTGYEVIQTVDYSNKVFQGWKRMVKC